MDARIFIVTILLCVHISTQQPQNATVRPETSTQKDSKPCVTGKGDDGTCVDRGACDYGTRAIDFSLYAKHGYKSVCASDQTCCPPSSVIVVYEPKPSQDSDDFSFNADDDI